MPGVKHVIPMHYGTFPVTMQVSFLLDCSLPTAVRQGSGVGAGWAAAGGPARTHSRPGGAAAGGVQS